MNRRAPARPQSGPSVAEIRALLEERALDVAQTYAPPVSGSYLDKGEWWTLNPGRHDTKVGSFVVHVAGPRRGKWHDFAAKTHGDLIDLIALRLNCDLKGALAEARRYLGLQEDTPEARRAREKAVEVARKRQAEADAQLKRQAEQRAKAGHAIWLNGAPLAPGCPAWEYLRARAIDLGSMARLPGALRWTPSLPYQHVDPATGDVIEGAWPAMLALMHGPDNSVVGVHRTYLAQGPAGWGKAPVPKAKKVLGVMRNARIPIWRGIVDGKPQRPLAQAAPGAIVYITEGIEDALSVAMMAPHLRVIAAISLGNMGLPLPESVAEVVIVADRDPSTEAQAALHRAVAAHREAGRRVRLWKPAPGEGKDVNEVLRHRTEQENESDRPERD